jgi:hypothetical protein
VLIAATILVAAHSWRGRRRRRRDISVTGITAALGPCWGHRAGVGLLGGLGPARRCAQGEENERRNATYHDVSFGRAPMCISSSHWREAACPCTARTGPIPQRVRRKDEPRVCPREQDELLASETP